MSVVTYKCPNCGGELTFDPESQKFQCEYCLSSFEEQELEHPTTDAPNAGTETPADEAVPEKDAVIYSCPNCGAEIITDSTTAATFCFYCHNPVILSGRLDGSLKPDAIIPFVIGREDAVNRFCDWIKKKWFVPRAFFSKEQIEKVSGIYFPYWLYECQMEGSFHATGDRVRAWTSGDYRYTEHSYYDVRRGGILHFRDLMKNALKKADANLSTGVLPFETRKIVPFSMAFLSGFQAEKRDIEIKELNDEIAGEMQNYARQLLRESADSYTSLSGESSQVRITGDSAQYVLLPVWILTYPKNGKTYYYAMNGQTGKVCGVLPVDWGKLLLVSGLLTVLLFLLLFLGGCFL